jgi:hypothetical protein
LTSVVGDVEKRRGLARPLGVRLRLVARVDVNAIDVTGVGEDGADLERLAAENVKRVVRGAADGQSLDDVRAFLELKTVWHPIGT